MTQRQLRNMDFTTSQPQLPQLLAPKPTMEDDRALVTGLIFKPVVFQFFYIFCSQAEEISP